MDFARALTYPFDDRQWVEKLAITAVMAFAAIIPLLGLVALAALLGFMVEIVQNIRAERKNPMPRWDNIGEKIGLGGNILVAGIVYGLPNILVVCCMLAVPLAGDAGRSDFFAGTFAVALFCCLIPLLLVYNIITLPMMALGTIRYSESRQIGVFFQFGDLFSTLSGQIGLVGQWLLFMFLVGLVFSLVNAIPCIGWVASLALTFPVYGHLLGQLAMALDDKRKGKPKRYNV